MKAGCKKKLEKKHAETFSAIPGWRDQLAGRGNENIEDAGPSQRIN
jgi:hypothetical protein